MFDRAQAPFTASASFLMALQPLLVAHSKNAAGGFDYSVPSSVMVSEPAKSSSSPEEGEEELLLRRSGGAVGTLFLSMAADAHPCYRHQTPS